MARALDELGVVSFRQIAEWDEIDQERVLTALKEKLRSPIRSSSWMEQAMRFVEDAD